MAKQQEKNRPGTALIDFLAGLSIEEMPSNLRRKAKGRLLDTVGCGLFASRFLWSCIVADFAADEGSTGRSTVFGRGRTVSPSRAAFCNGTMVHGFEFDDIVFGAVHPGTVVVPAALAMAEATSASPERLLLGIVAGYEMIGRVADALGADCMHRGFHITGVAGPAASAVAAGIVAGLDSETLTRAVGIACSSASGLKAFTQGTGGMVKRLHGGKAAEAGVTACQLAVRGFGGPAKALDGRFGLLDVIGGETACAERLSEGLGERWVIDSVWTKVYPCCGGIHTALQGLEALRKRDRIEPQDIVAVRIEICGKVVEQNNDTAPNDAMAAQYSMPFCGAVALTGDIRDPASFSDQGLQSSAVRDMIPRISLRKDAEFDVLFPERYPSRVTIATTASTESSLVVWDAHGTPNDPCDEEELKDKFRRLAGAVLSSQQADELIEAIVQLRSLADVSRILRSTVAPEAGGART